MFLKEVKKGAEFTYGVHGPSLAKLVPDNAFTLISQEDLALILQDLDDITMGSVRALNNKLELLRQAIGYTLFYRILKNLEGRPYVQFLIYRRNKTNGEGRLSSKLSLGAGGHVEGFDLEYHTIEHAGLHTQTPVIDLNETTDTSVFREGGEEVALFDQTGNDITDIVMIDSKEALFNKVGFVMDSKPEEVGYVGNVHYGVVYAVDASAADRFQMREPQNDAVYWASVYELKNGDMFKNPECPLEPWSQLIVDQATELEAYILANFHHEAV